MIGRQKNQRNTVRETKRYAGHTDKVSGLNESKNLATREKLEVWGINSTLGNYQIAVYLWNSGDVVLYKICIWLIQYTCQRKTASIQALVSDSLWSIKITSLTVLTNKFDK